MTALDPNDPRIPDHLRARMPQTNADGAGQMPAPVEGGAEALIAFAQALNAVENIAKTQTADTGKYTYRYADLGDVLDEVKRCCQMFRLAVTQNGSAADGMLQVSTTLIHYESGQWLTFPAMMLRMPADAQALGSALTYLRRYSLLTIFGIAPEDDDGAAATQAERTQAQTDGNRSEAERMIRDHVNAMDAEVRPLFISDFRTTFGMGLADLPVPKHGDALTWTRQWRPPEPAPATAAEGAGVAAAPEDTAPSGAATESDNPGNEIPADVTPTIGETLALDVKTADEVADEAESKS